MAKKRPKRPKRPKIKTAKDIIAEFGAVSIEELVGSPITKKPRKINIRTKPSKITRRRATTTKPKSTSKRRERIIEINVEALAAQSVRGTFEEGTFRTQASQIIHFFEYDIVSKQLAVQLTRAGKWNWYTYQNVSAQTAANFKAAPSKGQFFNRVIKKHNFLYGNNLRGFQTINEI